MTSPTFSIQTIYSNDLYHYDVYNKGLQEFISLGLLEEFEKSGLHFVEWGDERLEELLISYGFNVITVKIEKKIIKGNIKFMHKLEIKDITKKLKKPKYYMVFL